MLGFLQMGSIFLNVLYVSSASLKVLSFNTVEYCFHTTFMAPGLSSHNSLRRALALPLKSLVLIAVGKTISGEVQQVQGESGRKRPGDRAHPLIYFFLSVTLCTCAHNCKVQYFPQSALSKDLKKQPEFTLLWASSHFF